MASKLGKDTQAYKNKLVYIHKYTRENGKRISFLLSKKNDADIIVKLDNLSEGKATYIKRLIREDMKKSGE